MKDLEQNRAAWPVKNIYMWDLTHDYYVDIANKLTDFGCKIKVVGASRTSEYWPQALDEFISLEKPRVTLWDDYLSPERFNEILDPDYSILTEDVFRELSYYEKMFLLSTDRLAFFPLSQVDRCRLFYRFVGHFYKILKAEKLDCIIIFGIPHGLAVLALFGLAKVLKIKPIYIYWGGVSLKYATIETDIKTRRTYPPVEQESRLLANDDDLKRLDEFETFVYSDRPFIDENNNISQSLAAGTQISKKKKRLSVFVRAIGSLILRCPFGKYTSPGFFLNPGKRVRIGYALPLIKYYLDQSRAIKFYDRNASDVIPDNALVLFLHMQPEATTIPLGGIFADQLLVLDCILAALPAGMVVYVKEHPMMFIQFAQDKHERSVEFYSHMLRDPRVHFVNRAIGSQTLIEKARYVVSTNGTVCWEAMRKGKPSIVFSWAWFSECESCFVVDSVPALKDAFIAAEKKVSDEVIADVRRFLKIYQKRLIYAPADRSALTGIGSDHNYHESVVTLSKAIRSAIDAPLV